MTDSLTFIKPDDWHLHLRDDTALARTVTDASVQFSRAIIMPNTVPPITNAQSAMAYHTRIKQYTPADTDFNPLMTLYLTDNTSPEMIIEAAQHPEIVACKCYPAGATTNSQFGVTNLQKLAPTLEAMADAGLLLLVHGEVNDPSVDIFDREAVFIDKVLIPILEAHPKLNVVLEHATTAKAAELVESMQYNVAATLTPQHLWLTRNDLLVGGLRPHHYCLPILKRDTDRVALIRAATSGCERFFLGTDSAPHTQSKKETACGCAGIYTGYAAIAYYLEIFDKHNALDKFEGFASLHGPKFYGLPVNDTRLTFFKTKQRIPENLPFCEENLIPFQAGETLTWTMLLGEPM